MLLTILFITSLLFSGNKRLLRYLKYFQQEDYTPKRFLKWLFHHRIFDKRLSFVAISGFCLSLFDSQLALALGSLANFAIPFFEENPEKEGKIPLKRTDRANRIYYTAFLLQSTALLTLFLLNPNQSYFNWLWAIVNAQTSFLWLVASTHLLSFDESRRQNRLKQEAKDKLLESSPHIIGITGSYGKTSAKNLLGHTLQIALGPTFWPAKGVNTIMGTTREIHQRWNKGYRWAVMEMGAYYPGSIKRLCEFTPVNSAWITCIGLAHLERFKSAEAIQKTKSELAYSLAPGSLLVLNGDNPGCRQVAKEHTDKRVVLYGLDNTLNDLDVWIKSYSFSEKGSHFEIIHNNKTYQSTSLMIGTAALSNIAGAFAMATNLGADSELTLAAISQIRPIDNRLNIEKTKDNILYLHDAYNSNPTGFESALNVLKAIQAKRKILMTPGMIELGEKQKTLNKELIKKAASLCDFILIVGNHNLQALQKGLEEVSYPKDQYFLCSSREQAFQKLRELKKPEDAILIENDLGDLLEQLPRF